MEVGRAVEIVEVDGTVGGQMEAGVMELALQVLEGKAVERAEMVDMQARSTAVWVGLRGSVQRAMVHTVVEGAGKEEPGEVVSEVGEMGVAAPEMETRGAKPGMAVE